MGNNIVEEFYNNILKIFRESFNITTLDKIQFQSSESRFKLSSIGVNELNHLGLVGLEVVDLFKAIHKGKLLIHLINYYLSIIYYQLFNVTYLNYYYSCYCCFYLSAKIYFSYLRTKIIKNYNCFENFNSLEITVR